MKAVPALLLIAVSHSALVAASSLGRVSALLNRNESTAAGSGYREETTRLLNASSFGYSHARHQSGVPAAGFTSRLPQSVPPPGQSCPAEPACDDAGILAPYRTPDGTCNNVANPSRGSSGTPYRRLLGPKFSMVDCGRAIGNLIPNVRRVSLLLAKRMEAEDLSGRGQTVRRKGVAWTVPAWGQLVDHDINLTPLRSRPDGSFVDCCSADSVASPDCCSVLVPPDDPFYGKEGRPSCIPFLRSKLAVPPASECRRLPDVENSNTAYLDGSFLYGSDAVSQKKLRNGLQGRGRLMSTRDRRGREFPLVSSESGQVRMIFGDLRGDVHPTFTMLVTVFLRNHNRLADMLADAHRDWTDDQVFNEARKINVALLQHITFTQFLNQLLGQPNSVALPERGPARDDYDPQVDASISVEFSTAAYRLHTLVDGSLALADRNHVVRQRLRLRDVYHKPLMMLQNDTYDELMRGLCQSPTAEFDNIYTDEITEFLFPEEGKGFGLDLMAINVQRGRDHQIQGYTAYKRLCGLGTVHTWTDMADLIPLDRVHMLLHAYRNPDDVDLYIAGNMELPVAGSLIGPTMHCLVREQFLAMRNGDRFFYNRPGVFTPEQLEAIKRVTLARVLCDNADDPATMTLPKNVFKMANQRDNALFFCQDLVNHPPLDIHQWTA